MNKHGFLRVGPERLYDLKIACVLIPIEEAVD